MRTACGSCHPPDDAGRMSRISYMRKSPEGWQLTLKRMIRTGNVALSVPQARDIVRYLSEHHGLAPSEARPHFYRAERRPTPEEESDREVEVTCMRCHLGARYATQRRTSEEWALLKGMHLGYFPVVESQTFRAGGGEDPAGLEPEDPDGKEWRVDRALRTLSERYPLETPAWREFQAKGTQRSVEGRWLVSARVPGRGDAVGEVTLTKTATGYAYRGRLVHADGTSLERTGEGLLYGGYSWRGRSSGGNLGELREVMMLSDDGATLAGRAFRGAYGEIGVDVRMERLGADPRIADVVPRALPAGATGLEIRVSGANLPSDVALEDVNLGPGVRLLSLDAIDSSHWSITVDVEEGAPPGNRDLSFGSYLETDAVAVFDRVDYVKVEPEQALARVGGESAPKQFAQFEAVAFHRGPDGEAFTKDDIRLDVVPATWSLEEYHGRHDDDDVAHVGAIDDNGLVHTRDRRSQFRSRSERGQHGRRLGRGRPTAPDGATREVRGRARLVVTIPVYVFWDLFPMGTQ